MLDKFSINVLKITTVVITMLSYGKKHLKYVKCVVSVCGACMPVLVCVLPSEHSRKHCKRKVLSLFFGKLDHGCQFILQLLLLLIGMSFMSLIIPMYDMPF